MKDLMVKTIKYMKDAQSFAAAAVVVVRIA